MWGWPFQLSAGTMRYDILLFISKQSTYFGFRTTTLTASIIVSPVNSYLMLG